MDNERIARLCQVLTVHAGCNHYSAEKSVHLCICEYQVLPEEGVVLNADLPQSLRGPMVGQLEAYGALKLFILSGEGKE